MRQLLLLPVLSLLTITLAARAGQHVTGSGAVVRKALSVPAFHGIRVEGAIDVVLTPAAGQQVDVEAQENLVDLVTTEVRNGIWTIAVREGYTTNKPFTVHISAPTIDQVSVEGSGDVKGLGPFKAERVRLGVRGSGDLAMAFTATAVDVLVQGSGDVELAGTCADMDLAVQGSGDINAKAMKAERVRAASNGSGDMVVFVSRHLKATVAGSGDVAYTGGPQNVEKQVAGSGAVRAIGGSGSL